MERFEIFFSGKFDEKYWLGRDVIVKVQLPLAGSSASPPALVYDEDRLVDGYIQISDRLVEYLKAQPKSFVKARLFPKVIEFHGPAQWQGW